MRTAHVQRLGHCGFEPGEGAGCAADPGGPHRRPALAGRRRRAEPPSPQQRRGQPAFVDHHPAPLLRPCWNQRGSKPLYRPDPKALPVSLILNRRHALALATAAACPSLHAQIPPRPAWWWASGRRHGDFIARTLADTLRAKGFAQSVIVENRAGAGGVLSVQTVKAATPDGTTLLSTPATVLTVLPHTHRKPPFDVFRTSRRSAPSAPWTWPW